MNTLALLGRQKRPRLLSLLLPLLLLLAVCCNTAVADQVTVPLADTAGQTGGQQQPAAPGQPAGLSPPAVPDQLYDIKGPVPLPDHGRLLWLLAIGITLILLFIAIILFLRKRTQTQKVALAHETALQQLDRAEQLIKQGDTAAFINLIDQTLRRYIEQRFRIVARRQTTREFVTNLAEGKNDGHKGAPLALQENSDNLKTWLQHCDMVKFAKAALTREAMLDMAGNIRGFIQATKKEEENE